MNSGNNKDNNIDNHFTVLGNISASAFLANYWQKQPLLIRNAIPGFTTPVSPDELAGLACHENVESRIVLEKDGSTPWELRHGPFDENLFSELPETHWTLLVQECNKYIPELAALLDQFCFIPNWRIDDIMVSYAAPQGSVGPHVDQYDVFLLQGLGKRLWQIDSESSQHLDFLPDTELRILQNFTANHEWLLEPGDMLYLPPGVAHHGIAQDDCVTLSVGFRAPSHYELLTAFAEDQFSHITDPFKIPRYQDPDLLLTDNCGEITRQALGNIIEILQSYTRNEHDMARWFGRFITEPKFDLNDFQPEIAYSRDSLIGAIQQHRLVCRSENVRFSYIKATPETTYLYVNGREFELSADQQQLAPVVCNQRQIESSQVGGLLAEDTLASIVVNLFNEGHLYFPPQEENDL